MILERGEVEDEKGPASLLGWMTVFEPSEIDSMPWSRPSTRCSMVGCSGSGAESGMLSFVAGC